MMMQCRCLGKMQERLIAFPLSRSSENRNTDLKFTFSPMHGVGGEAVVRAFEMFNLPELIPVVKQMQPDPEFPTVVFPNPEEGKSALVSSNI